MVDFEADIVECIRVLQAGGLILYPTDTIWGVGCDATNESAVNRVFALKQRDSFRSMIVLVATKNDVIRYVASPDLATFDYLETITKPTTVIYQGAIGLASNLVHGDGSVAIRIVQDPFCRHLVRRFRKPIVSTSANFSGQPAPSTFNDITEELKSGVEYIVCHRQNDLQPATASTIITWENGAPRVIRP